jgi:hypothetical protein
MAVTNAFQYMPLAEGTSSTRFVRILPSHPSRQIECVLEPMGFGEKPKYKALSYMWGDERGKQRIRINDAEFWITRNLHDALLHLRWRRETGLFWIDAICINQDDVQERNRQLRMMSHIFFRAEFVVVWLGVHLQLTYEQDDGQRQYLYARSNPDGTFADLLQVANAAAHSRLREASGLVQDLREGLARDPYWRRVWIIQEIGLAQGIDVHFGLQHLSWLDFIRQLRKSPVARIPAHGPYRLDDQLRRKYGDGHTLLSLLRSSRDSLCKDPRDKVYGLVGLAADARGLPMDYQKSVFEVWSDTVAFVTEQRLCPPDETLSVAREIQETLLKGETGISPAKAFDLTAEKEEVVQRVYRVEGHILGYIAYLGPTPANVISDLEETDEWSQALSRNFKDNLGPAEKESHDLLRSLLKLGLSKRFGVNGKLRCRLSSDPADHQWLNQDGYYTPPMQKPCVLEYSEPHYLESAEKELAAVRLTRKDDRPSRPGDDISPRLFQLGGLEDEALGMTGLASHDVRKGDIVVAVNPDRDLLILRAQITPPQRQQIGGSGFKVNHRVKADYLICGTASLTNDICGLPRGTDRDAEGKGEMFKFAFPQSKSLFGSAKEVRKINLDLGTETFLRFLESGGSQGTNSG